MEQKTFKVCESEMLSKMQMINFDDYSNENKTKQLKLAIYSGLSIQNINNRSYWIWRNKCIIKFNKQPARY